MFKQTHSCCLSEEFFCRLRSTLFPTYSSPSKISSILPCYYFISTPLYPCPCQFRSQSILTISGLSLPFLQSMLHLWISYLIIIIFNIINPHPLSLSLSLSFSLPATQDSKFDAVPFNRSDFPFPPILTVHQ